MNLYIMWTAVGTEAESQQIAFKWLGTMGDAERALEVMGRRITSWYVSNGDTPRACVDLNMLQHGKRSSSNEFFDQKECPFEVCGFYEELMDPISGKVYGYRNIPAPTRKLGSEGRIEFEVKETLALRKGTKQVLLKASPKRPVRVCAMIQVVCGRTKAGLAAEQAGAFYPQPPQGRL